jgi:hypothetical protein
MGRIRKGRRKTNWEPFIMRQAELKRITNKRALKDLNHDMDGRLSMGMA